MSTAASAGHAKPSAKIAMLGLDSASAAVLSECFRQFGVEASVVNASEAPKITSAYNACVVPLEAKSEHLLRDLRRATHGIVIYGVCATVSDALPFAKYGINAVFQMPVREREAMQVVRSTHLLLMKELRRYVRVPLVCPLTIETGTQVLHGSTLEISAGGMLLTTKASLTVPQAVLASFALPGATATSIRSIVCWTRDDEGTAAIRFDPGDTRRAAVRQWIDDYLGA
ncbi:MAG: PilZ domain-containing protein [Terriglobales bacterium]